MTSLFIISVTKKVRARDRNCHGDGVVVVKDKELKSEAWGYRDPSHTVVGGDTIQIHGSRRRRPNAHRGGVPEIEEPIVCETKVTTKSMGTGRVRALAWYSDARNTSQEGRTLDMSRTLMSRSSASATAFSRTPRVWSTYRVSGMKKILYPKPIKITNEHLL